jgi:hypothetical protein
MLGRSRVLAALVALFVSFATHAADSYPARPILLILSKVSTPIQHLDQPEFQRLFAADAKRLAEAVHNLGRVEEKK